VRLPAHAARIQRQCLTLAANIPIEPYAQLLDSLPLGVYYGWASVGHGPVYKAAISIGWNPFYKNTHKTIEIHLMHSFASDFYGSHLQLSLQGYIRPEWDFTSLDELKKAIQGDIAYSDQHLDRLDPAVAAFFAGKPADSAASPAAASSGSKM
jgi:riboflavin kinase